MILASNKTFTKGDERNVAPFGGTWECKTVGDEPWAGCSR
jgi:hypothetical protein